MSRLINADALVERLKPYIEKYGAEEFPYNMVQDAFIYEVEQEPTVEAIPIEYMQSQVDCGKWAEIIQRWREGEE